MKDNMETITLRMTRQRAKEFGLLTCKNCWWPENNHFQFGTRKCANDPNCTGFEEAGRMGVEIVG